MAITSLSPNDALLQAEVRVVKDNTEEVIRGLAQKLGRVFLKTAKDVARDIKAEVINRETPPTLDDLAKPVEEGGYGHPYRVGGPGFAHPFTFSTHAQGNANLNARGGAAKAKYQADTMEDGFDFVISGIRINKHRVNVSIYLGAAPAVASGSGVWSLPLILHEGTEKMQPRPFLTEGAKLFTLSRFNVHMAGVNI